MVTTGLNLKNPSTLLAVKIIGYDDHGLERFEREMKAGSKLPEDCENIVRILQRRVVSDRHAYIFMEYCNGSTLTHYIKNSTWNSR